MAEKIQDAEDRLLESMFESESILDDGFSGCTVRRIRRQIWARRLTLPIAMIIGAAIALKPATQLFSVGAQIFASLQTESLLPNSAFVSELPIVVMVALGLAIAVLTFHLLEE